MDQEDVWRVSEIIEPAKLNINQWSKDDRPREKLMKNGAKKLSNAELLAILIGSGNTNESAVDLMRRIMHHCNDKLKTLGKLSIKELTSYKGIGEAKAITILAACELGRRRQMEEFDEKPILDSAEKAYEYMRLHMQDLKREQGWVLLMNNRFQLIEGIKLSEGGMTETAIDVRQIMKAAIENEATVITLCHNHPSGNLNPSRDDDRLTSQVKAACQTMRIHMADHIIVTDRGYYSYTENGRI